MKLLNTTSRIVTLWVIAMLVMISGLRAESPENESAERVVITLQNALIQAMQQGQKIGYSGRLELLTPVIRQSHDFVTILSKVLRDHWAEFSPEQQQAITQAFQANSIATYADRFNQYDGEQFKIIEQTQLPRGQMLIRSQFVRSGSSPINFDYVMHEAGGSWRIINILVNGVSDIALKRTEFKAILQKNDITALIDMLKQKTSHIEQNQR